MRELVHPVSTPDAAEPLRAVPRQVDEETFAVGSVAHSHATRLAGTNHVDERECDFDTDPRRERCIRGCCVEVPVEVVVAGEEGESRGIPKPGVDDVDGIVSREAPQVAQLVAGFVHFMEFDEVAVEASGVGVGVEKSGEIGGGGELIETRSGGARVSVGEHDGELESDLGVRGKMQFDSLFATSLLSAV